MPDTGSVVTFVSKGLCDEVGLSVTTGGDTFCGVVGQKFQTIGVVDFRIILEGKGDAPNVTISL